MTALAKAIDALDGSHPSSDGAHRLAWWLCADDARWTVLIASLDVSPATIDRLLSGAIEPSDGLALLIASVTVGEVRPEDWTRGGPLGWADRPRARESKR